MSLHTLIIVLYLAVMVSLVRLNDEFVKQICEPSNVGLPRDSDVEHEALIGVISVQCVALAGRA